MSELPLIKYGYEKIENLDIFYREAGLTNRSTLLFLPGFPYSPSVINDFINKLSDNFHVISPDYPGFGNSSRPSPLLYDYSLNNLATTLKNFTYAKELENYTIFAQDLGGEIGLRMTVDNSERVSGIILNNWKEQLIHQSDVGSYSFLDETTLETTKEYIDDLNKFNPYLTNSSFDKPEGDQEQITRHLFNINAEKPTSALINQIINNQIPVLTTHYASSDAHVSDTYHLINSYNNLR